MTSLGDYDGYVSKFALDYGDLHESKPTVLDVGCGRGRLGSRIRWHCEYIDGVEIFEPYIGYNHKVYYRNVIIGNIVDLEIEQEYDIAIMMDMLEHLSVEDAQQVLQKLKSVCKVTIVVVPWMYPQEAINGNPYEEHLQPDLDLVKMGIRYPTLQMSAMNNRLGVYIQR